MGGYTKTPTDRLTPVMIGCALGGGLAMLITRGMEHINTLIHVLPRYLIFLDFVLFVATCGCLIWCLATAVIEWLVPGDDEDEETVLFRDWMETQYCKGQIGGFLAIFVSREFLGYRDDKDPWLLGSILVILAVQMVFLLYHTFKIAGETVNDQNWLPVMKPKTSSSTNSSRAQQVWSSLISQLSS